MTTSDQPDPKLKTFKDFEAEETSLLLVPMTHLELILIRGAVGVLGIILCWLAASFYGTLIAIAQIQTQLALAPPGEILETIRDVQADLHVKPAEILAAVHKAEKNAITEDRVAVLISEYGPWVEAREGWQKWRELINAELIKQNEQIQILSNGAGD